MNIKTMAIAAVAVIGMTACQKNGGSEPETDGAGTVSIALSQELGAKTRAVGAPQTANSAVTLNDGWVIFTNDANSVNKVVEIATGTYAVDTDPNKATAQANGTKVWLGDMTATGGSAINNVPAAATRVWIAGNLNGLTPPALGENITAIKGRTVAFGTQNNATGTTANVTLWGGKDDHTDAPALLSDNTLTPLPGDKYAKVAVDAVAARIELGSIVYENSTNFVTAFRLNGIFLNKYYPTMTLNSEASSNVNWQPADATIAATMFAGGSAEYPLAASGALYDYNASGIGTAVSPGVGYNAGGTNVWAYNVLAPQTFVSPLTAMTPQLIVRISNITTPTDPNFYGSSDQYLTVKTFKEATAPYNTVASFQPGYVYYITKLAFDESHLTPVPNQAEVIAYVEAQMMQWQRTEITGEY